MRSTRPRWRTFARSSKQLVEWSFDLDVVTTAMITFGAVTLVVIIAQVERRAAARNRHAGTDRVDSLA